MTLIEVRTSSGLVARCDAKCHDAEGPECDCVCGGRYHGKRSGSRELAEVVRADGYALVQRLASEAGGQVGEGVEQLCNLSLPGLS